VKRRPHPVEAGYRLYETITGLNLADDPIWREVYVWQKRAAILAILLCAAVATLIAIVLTHSPAPRMCPTCGTAAPVVHQASVGDEPNTVNRGAGE